MNKILIVFILLIIASCQPTARFIDTDKKSNVKTNKNVKDNSNISKNNDTQNYNYRTNIIYPKDISGKYSSKIINIAEKWLGTPYLYGGTTKIGVDCSGFVKNVYKEIGIDLPRTSAEQYETLKPTNSPNIGDLVFFKKGNKINHVGIFIGNGKIIHSSLGKGVIIQPILGTPLERNFAGYRKI